MILSKFAQYYLWLSIDVRSAYFKSAWKNPPCHLMIVAGPRQVGETTLVFQAVENYGNYFVSADGPEAVQLKAHGVLFDEIGKTSELEGIPRDAPWLIRQWQNARQQLDIFASSNPGQPFVFVVDEVQKIPRWSEAVKGLWDEDRRQGLLMHVILLGSSPLLIQKGMTESLAGRYELIRVGHWSFGEMHQAFDFTLDEYVFFGGDRQVLKGAVRMQEGKARIAVGRLGEFRTSRGQFRASRGL
jgi:uncharacterized protein